MIMDDGALRVINFIFSIDFILASSIYIYTVGATNEGHDLS